MAELSEFDPNCVRVDDLLNGHQSLMLGLVVHPTQIFGLTPHEGPFCLVSFRYPSTLRELILICRTPQLLALQIVTRSDRPVIAGPDGSHHVPHRPLVVYMLRNKHVVQLKEATIVGYSVRPAGVMVPFNMWEGEWKTGHHFRKVFHNTTNQDR